MANKQRGKSSETEPNAVTVSISKLTGELLEKIDSRAAELDMNRSQYFRWLAKLDLRRAHEQKEAA